MDDSKNDNGPLVYINGKRFDLPTDRPEYTLLHFLRGMDHLPGGRADSRVDHFASVMHSSLFLVDLRGL